MSITVSNRELIALYTIAMQRVEAGTWCKTEWPGVPVLNSY